LNLLLLQARISLIQSHKTYRSCGYTIEWHFPVSIPWFRSRTNQQEQYNSANGYRAVSCGRLQHETA